MTDHAGRWETAKEAIGSRKTPSIVALIPARAGSKRIPGKNLRRLDGHPLLAYTIAAAQQSGIFDAIVVSTDGTDAGAIAVQYGADWCPRPPALAADDSPDIDWVRHALADTAFRAFAILRPTSPFRSAATIRRAWAQFLAQTPTCDSLRAVEPVRQHPGKMWRLRRGLIDAIWDGQHDQVPYHSRPTQTLPPVLVQNASLELAWTWVVTDLGTISGTKIQPFYTEDYEGFDLNDERDWREAETLLAAGVATLPRLAAAPL